MKPLSVWAKIALLILLALSVRAALALNTKCISNDGPEYIRVAQMYSNGHFNEAIRHSYQPLYPMLIALTHIAVQNWETAALVPGILLSSFGVLFLFLITRRLFNERTAVIACLLYAIIPFPAIFSSQIFTTGAFIFFFLLSVWIGTEALIREKYYLFLLLGISAIFCYLIRPDGILLIPAYMSVLLLKGFLTKEPRLKKTALILLNLLLPIIALTACYLLFNYENISSVLPKKMSLTNLTEDLISRPEFLHHHETPLYVGDETYLWVILKILNIFIGTCPHIFFVFLVFGIIKRRLFPYSLYNELPCLLLLILSCLMMALFVLFFSGYVSRRHFAPIAVISLPWISVGILEAEFRIRKWFAFAAKNLHETGIIVYAILSVIFIISLFKLSIPIGADKLGERKSGEWILSEFPGRHSGFLTNVSRVAYYAGSYERNYNITALPYDDNLGYIQYSVIIKFANDCNLDFVVVDNVVNTFAPDFMTKASQGADLTLVHDPIPKSSSPSETNFIYIYKVNKWR